MNCLNKFIISTCIVLFFSASMAQSVDTDTAIVDSTITDSTDINNAIGKNEDSDSAYYFAPTFDTLIIYNDNEVNINLIDTISSLNKEDDFWYVNATTNAAKIDTNKDGNWLWLLNFISSKAFSIIIWVLAIGLLLGILIIYLNDNNIGFFAKKSKAIVQHDEDEKIPENIFEINFDKAIDAAKLNNNYRQATRLYFLKILKNLNDKKLIQYSLHTTNFEYLMALSGHSIYTQFTNAIRNYEFVWYGEFQLTQSQFGAIEVGFIKILKTISNP